MPYAEREQDRLDQAPHVSIVIEQEDVEPVEIVFCVRHDSDEGFPDQGPSRHVSH
jgi:hypothetical protein